MNAPDDLRNLRRYQRGEVATLLNISDSWLKRWVTADAIPFQRSGAQRGVWFTYADILAIGRMLPGLMTGRQANSRADGGVGAERPSEDVQLVASEVDVARFASLRSLRN